MIAGLLCPKRLGTGFSTVRRPAEEVAQQLLYSEILHGAAARLPSRLPDLMFWIALPFLDAEASVAERERDRGSILRS